MTSKELAEMLANKPNIENIRVVVDATARDSGEAKYVDIDAAEVISIDQDEFVILLREKEWDKNHKA